MEKVDEVFKQSEEQIEVYAAAFREGDAVKVGDKWYKVNKNKNWNNTVHFVPDICIKDNDFFLNYLNSDIERHYKGMTEGFNSSYEVKRPYKIIMPKDYEAKDGDKLVWLGKTNDFLTFGKVYEASGAVSMLGTHYIADDGSCRFIAPLAVKYWGVIPKWKNVEEER